MCRAIMSNLYTRKYSICFLRKPAFCICENKDADQLCGNRTADQRLFFATKIVQSLCFLNPKFQASSHLMWLYSPVFVGPGRKPQRRVFSRGGSPLFYRHAKYSHNSVSFSKFIPTHDITSFNLNGKSNILLYIQKRRCF